jgi:hypothetical protein
VSVLAVLVLSAAVVGCIPLPPPTSTAPIRAAFYYPWFPQGWSQQGQPLFTNYTVTRGQYSSSDTAIVAAQIADMQYAGIKVGIASWFGQGTVTDQHWPSMIQAAAGTGFGWAPYYEPEGISDPPPQQISDDLFYLWSTYQSALTTINGKGMLVFVYNADDPTTAKGCDTVARWTQARQLLAQQHSVDLYIDLKVFPGYTSCAGTIDGWHQYGPASAVADFSKAPGDGSYSISPGYWKSGATYGTSPFLARDRSRWQASIASMVASGARWQLITTFDEWGEGTAIESSSGCRNPAPVGTYCAWGNDLLDDLHASP